MADLNIYSSNEEIYKELKERYVGSYEYILVGNKSAPGDYLIDIVEEDAWKILAPRVRDFLVKEYKIYCTYRKDYRRCTDWVFERFLDSFEVYCINFGQGYRNNKTMTIVVEIPIVDPISARTVTYDHTWITRNISDFLDPDFETNYATRIGDKQLEKITEKINKTMDYLGKLLEEQERLQNKKRENL